MSDLTKCAIDSAFAIWNRGYLLDGEKCSFETECGKVSFVSDSEKLTATISFKKTK